MSSKTIKVNVEPRKNKSLKGDHLKKLKQRATSEILPPTHRPDSASIHTRAPDSASMHGRAPDSASIHTQVYELSNDDGSRFDPKQANGNSQNKHSPKNIEGAKGKESPKSEEGTKDKDSPSSKSKNGSKDKESPSSKSNEGAKDKDSPSPSHKEKSQTRKNSPSRNPSLRRDIYSSQNSRIKTDILDFAKSEESLENFQFLFDLNHILNLLEEDLKPRRSKKESADSDDSDEQQNNLRESVEKEPFYQNRYRVLYESYIGNNCRWQLNLSGDCRYPLDQIYAKIMHNKATKQKERGNGSKQKDNNNGANQKDDGNGSKQKKSDSGLKQNSSDSGSKQNNSVSGSKQNNSVSGSKQNNNVSGFKQNDKVQNLVATDLTATRDFFLSKDFIPARTEIEFLVRQNTLWRYNQSTRFKRIQSENKRELEIVTALMSSLSLYLKTNIKDKNDNQCYCWPFCTSNYKKNAIYTGLEQLYRELFALPKQNLDTVELLEMIRDGIQAHCNLVGKNPLQITKILTDAYKELLTLSPELTAAKPALPRKSIIVKKPSGKGFEKVDEKGPIPGFATVDEKAFMHGGDKVDEKVPKHGGDKPAEHPPRLSLESPQLAVEKANLKSKPKIRV